MTTTRPVDPPQGPSTPDQARTLSGRSFLERIRDGILPGPAIATVLNYRLETVADGTVTFRGAPTADHLNPLGTVHGGWYGTLLDSCMGCAVQTGLPAGTIYTTLEYKVNMTRAIPPGRTVLATGTVSHAGRSTAVAEGTIRDAETGRLYATGSTTCLIMKAT